MHDRCEVLTLVHLVWLAGRSVIIDQGLGAGEGLLYLIAMVKINLKSIMTIAIRVIWVLHDMAEMAVRESHRRFQTGGAGLHKKYLYPQCIASREDVCTGAMWGDSDGTCLKCNTVMSFVN